VAPVIQAEGLTKRFGDLVALDSLDLTVEVGEIVGYLGPNGAGKSTTIRLMLDAIRPTSGSVRVLGAPAGDVPTRRRIGYLPADVRLDPGYTGDDVFAFFGALRGVDDRGRAPELCERFGLDPTRRIKELSTGNRRKVAIVQAFMHEPELLILDEPTSGLDPLLQDEFLHLVREESGRGVTVFLSSHVLREVDQLADRIGVLRAGHLIAVTSLADLRAKSRLHLDLYIEGPVDTGVFENIPEVVSVAQTDGIVHLVVAGSVDAVVKAAAAFDVRRLVTPEADLEDLFLDLYRDAGVGPEVHGEAGP
jgi:ABC-2 type transport system ATP-binding protein